MTTPLQLFRQQVQEPYFSHFPIVPAGPGQYAGLFLKHRIESDWRQIDADTWVAATRYRGPSGQLVQEHQVLALCRASETAVVLDRFARAVHLLNLSERVSTGQTVYLPVSMALVNGVSHGHGRVFRAIVERLQLPCTVGILLPTPLRQRPHDLSRIAANYRQNGFLTAVSSGEQLQHLAGQAA